jgi:alpha-beta hydrolase superfamily lysophospholipase
MAEFIERYEEMAEMLALAGYVVYGSDHVGHGNSINNNNELGHIEGKEGYLNLCKDVHILSNIAKNENQGIPLILYGHSMGSMVARVYASIYSGIIDGLILSGTSGKNPIVSLGLLLINIIAVFKGSMYRSSLIFNMAFGSYNDKFKDKLTKYDWLSVDKDNVARYIADEKCGYVFTLSGFRALLKLVKKCNSKICYMNTPKQLPILLISGKDDPVGNYGNAIVEIEHTFKSVGIEDITMVIYNGLRHEIHNEKEKSIVYQDILTFIEKILRK